MKKIVVFIILLCFFVTGCSVKKVNELTDAEKFANEFNVSDKNPFVYASIDDVIHIFTSDTGIIFIANSDEEGSLKAAPILTDAAKSVNIEKIYYYNPKKLKESSPKKYKKLLEIINSYLENDSKNKKLKLPNVYTVKSGKITGYSNYFSSNEQLSADKLTKKKKNKIRNEYINLLKDFKDAD